MQQIVIIIYLYYSVLCWLELFFLNPGCGLLLYLFLPCLLSFLRVLLIISDGHLSAPAPWLYIVVDCWTHTAICFTLSLLSHARYSILVALYCGLLLCFYCCHRLFARPNHYLSAMAIIGPVRWASCIDHRCIVVDKHGYLSRCQAAPSSANICKVTFGNNVKFVSVR